MGRRHEGGAGQRGDVERACVLPVHELPGPFAGEIEGAGGGWSFVLSDLKTLLETGKSLAA